MMEDIKEIEKHVDSIIRKSKHRRRSKKILGLSVPVFAIIVSGMLVSGALIGVLFTQYNLNLQGAVSINGAAQGAAPLLYDGTPLATQTTTITAMDYDVLNAGDTYTATHVISSLDAQNDWVVVFNLSNMPLNYVDHQNVWYGFTFEVREHGTTTPITEVLIGAGATVEFDYYYNVNALFADPLIAFPFDLRMNIVMNSTITPPNTPPVVSNIPNQPIKKGGTFTTIPLDNYVADAEDPDSAIVWSYSGNTALTVSITNRVATITQPSSTWTGTETITFTATDTGGLNDSDAAIFSATAGTGGGGGGPNIQPVAVDDTVEFAATSPLAPPIVHKIDVLANDHDDGHIGITNVVRIGGDRNFPMTFNAKVVSVTTSVVTGTTIYQVTITDDGGLSDTSTLYVHVF